jgi:ribose transport system permease protein
MKHVRIISSLLKRFAIILVFLGLCIFFTILNPAFIGIENIMQVLRNVAIMGIVCIGMSYSLISGGIDLSVGTIQGFSLIIAALMVLRLGVPFFLAAIIGILAGVIIGLINGFVINELNVPPLITTLATMTIFRGVIYVLTGAKSVFGFQSNITTMGQGFLGIVPIPVIIFAFVFILGWFFLTRTTIGRYFYGVGSNSEVARLSGINVKRIRYLVYIISGLLSGFAGIMLLSRLNSGQPRAGIGLEFEVITAVVLGGVSIAGGEGKLYGVLFGALIMGVLKNGLILTGVTEYYQMIITGAVLIIAVSIDTVSKKRRVKIVDASQEDIY